MKIYIVCTENGLWYEIEAKNPDEARSKCWCEVITPSPIVMVFLQSQDLSE